MLVAYECGKKQKEKEKKRKSWKKKRIAAE